MFVLWLYVCVLDVLGMRVCVDVECVCLCLVDGRVCGDVARTGDGWKVNPKLCGVAREPSARD